MVCTLVVVTALLKRLKEKFSGHLKVAIITNIKLCVVQVTLAKEQSRKIDANVLFFKKKLLTVIFATLAEVGLHILLFFFT